MTPKTPDPGHRTADKELNALIRRLHLSYRQAGISLQEKIVSYMEQFEKEDAEQRALYDAGKLSHEDYMAWRYRKIAGTKQWKTMLEQLTTDMVHQDQIAASMIHSTLPGVYAENHNYGTYEAETGAGVDTTYTLYDKDTVARLLKGNPDLLPQPSVDDLKDARWNRQHIQSSVLQGILTGEPMKKIADRFQQVVGMDERAAMRNARTAVTGAENAGRIDSYKRAQAMGIEMKQVWMATLDGRTRDSHAAMDGEKVEVGKKFSNGCRYPGDPEGASAEIYNCRCTLVAEVEGSDPYDPAVRPSAYLEEQGLTYEQWKDEHRIFENNSMIRRENIESYDQIKETALVNNLVHNPVEKLENELTSDEIIDRLAGGDRTNGSCVSLSIAYAGNKCGLDVLDFRGGASQKVFSRYRNMEKTLRAANAKIEIYDANEELKQASKILKNLTQNKEYIFAAGKHTTIVRKTEENGLQFLEMQSPVKNGWMLFKTENSTVAQTLSKRFGCRKYYSGSKAFLIEVESIRPTNEFRDIIGYINTASDKQKKGSNGRIR